MNGNACGKRLLCGLLSLAGAALAAPGDVIGPPLRVAGPSYSEPRLARGADGRAVAATVQFDGRRRFLTSAQRIDASGALAGAPIVAAGPNDDFQYSQRVAMNAGGGFAIVYEDGVEPPLFPDPFLNDVLALRLETRVRNFAADGTPLSPTIVVEESRVPLTYVANTVADVALDDGGAFVVAWHKDTFAGLVLAVPVSTAIYARRYSARGLPLTPTIQVSGALARPNAAQPEFYQPPAVAPHGAGNFAVAWIETAPNGTNSVQLRRYSALGVQLGAAATVSGGSDQPGTLAMAMNRSGALVLAYNGCFAAVCARSFGPGGTPDSGPLAAGEDLPPPVGGANQYGLSIAIDAAGDFVLAALHESPDPAQRGPYLRRFNAAGPALARSQAVGFPGNEVSVASDGIGNFAVLYYDNSNRGTYLQRYAGP